MLHKVLQIFWTSDRQENFEYFVQVGICYLNFGIHPLFEENKNDSFSPIFLYFTSIGIDTDKKRCIFCLFSCIILYNTLVVYYCWDFVAVACSKVGTCEKIKHQWDVSPVLDQQSLIQQSHNPCQLFIGILQAYLGNTPQRPFSEKGCTPINCNPWSQNSRGNASRSIFQPRQPATNSTNERP